MKAAARIRVVVSVILFAALWMTGCSDGAYVAQNVTKSATVVAKGKDAAGKATSIEIKSGAEPGITVEKTGKGKELFGLVGKKVEVSGLVRGTGENQKIEVTSYKVID